MAILTAAQLAVLRNCAVRNALGPPATKPSINAALQAIEDRMQLAATKTALANDIEAVAPGMFTAAQKQLLFGVWCFTAAARLGVT